MIFCLFEQCLESIDPVVDYIESHLRKASSVQGMSDSDMISMLSGNGGSQVDLVLYVFSQSRWLSHLLMIDVNTLAGVKPVDIEYLRRLSHLTNVIPLISRSDLLSTEDLSSLRENIISSLETASIRPFQFNHGSFHQLTPPYTISTYPSKDHDTMDASLLMSPDYIQPLLPSDLTYLVSQIFSRDTISWLRHSAAKKFTVWRASTTPLSRPQSLYNPLAQPTSQALTGPVGATTSYALARITDHTQREERIAQVRLANWAADLQRSLANERARFENLARAERAIWLTERLGECVQDGTIVPLSEARQTKSEFPLSAYEGILVKQGTYSRKRGGVRRGEIDTGDPLGLLKLNEELKRKGWVALKVVSGLGVIGGLAWWISRWGREQLGEGEVDGVWGWVLNAL